MNENQVQDPLDRIFDDTNQESVSSSGEVQIDPSKLRTRNPAPRPFAPQVVEEFKPVQGSEFLGENAMPTYYYLNVSEGKVVLGDLGVTLIQGQPVDMLDIANEEDILKSKDLRSAQRAHATQTPLLKRLTLSEFNTLYNKWVENQNRITSIKEQKEKDLDEAQKNPQAFRISKNTNAKDNLNIRPGIQSLIEKLRIGTFQVNDREMKEIAQNKVAGISPEEFLMKTEVMQLTMDEVEFVFQTVMNKQVREALQNKYGYKG